MSDRRESVSSFASNRRPAASLQKRVSYDLDVVATPNKMRKPTQRWRYVFDWEEQTAEKEDEQKPAERDRLHRRRLVRNRGADHRAKRRDTERVKDRGDNELVAAEAAVQVAGAARARQRRGDPA